MKRVCVFCGSSAGVLPEYAAAAKRLGEVLVENNISLVYGGAKVGIMGALADSVLKNGGDVIGVMPQDIVEMKVAHQGLADLRIVGSMHERKAMMADLADAFITLPGGLGTMEEFFEVITWSQLGMHTKACGVLNIANFYDKLLDFIDHAVDQKFLRKEHRQMLIIEQDPSLLLNRMKSYLPPRVEKWVSGMER